MTAEKIKTNLQMKGKTMKIAHVTIHSAKKDETVRFYQEYCGLKVQRELGDMITFLADGEGQTAVEVIDDAQKAAQTSGLSIGFAVDDVEAYREKLVADGLEPTEIISPNPHVKFFFVKDPNGIDIQFI